MYNIGNVNNDPNLPTQAAGLQPNQVPASTAPQQAPAPIVPQQIPTPVQPAVAQVSQAVQSPAAVPPRVIPVPQPIYPNRNPIVVKKKSSAGGIIGGIVGFVMFFVVVFFVYGLTWEEPSNVSTGDVPYQTVAPTPTGPPTTLTFIPQATILQLHSVVDAATSLQEIDTQLTAAIQKAENPPGRKQISTPKINTTDVVDLKYNNLSVFPTLKMTPATNSDLPAMKRYLNYFIDEYTKYPLEFMPAVNPPAFAFAKHIVDPANGGEAGGYTHYIVAYGLQDVLNREDAEGIDYYRRIIHHEIGHSFDTVSLDDETDWPGILNKDRYKTKVDLGALANHVFHPTPGFVTGYAQYNENEDLAETYSFLFVRADYKRMAAWAQNDPLLTEKITYLKKQMQTFTTKMDDAYFLSLQ